MLSRVRVKAVLLVDAVEIFLRFWIFQKIRTALVFLWLAFFMGVDWSRDDYLLDSEITCVYEPCNLWKWASLNWMKSERKTESFWYKV